MANHSEKNRGGGGGNKPQPPPAVVPQPAPASSNEPAPQPSLEPATLDAPPAVDALVGPEETSPKSTRFVAARRIFVGGEKGFVEIGELFHPVNDAERALLLSQHVLIEA